MKKFIKRYEYLFIKIFCIFTPSQIEKNIQDEYTGYSQVNNN